MHRAAFLKSTDTGTYKIDQVLGWHRPKRRRRQPLGWSRPCTSTIPPATATNGLGAAATAADCQALEALLAQPYYASLLAMGTYKPRPSACFGLAASCLIALTLTTQARADSGANVAQVAQWQSSYKTIWSKNACAQTESWDSYWGWIQQFFLGNFFDRGWFADVGPITIKIADAGKQQAIQSALTDLGREIAAEWGKPNSCRNVDTAMLKAWYGDLKAAASRDSGDGQAIQAEINAINQKVHSN